MKRAQAPGGPAPASGRRLTQRAAAPGTAVVAAAAARAAYAGLTRRPPGGTKLWARTNHRGEPVTLLEGPAAAAGAIVAAVIAPGLPARTRAAIALAGAGSAGFGCYDDLAGSGKRRGFRGHLGALAHGELTSGAVKIGGIGATGVTASMLLGGPLTDQIINAGLVAGAANLLNLFDLRPGRASKVAVTAAALLAAGSQAAVPDQRAAARCAAAAPAGAALALLGEDLGERAMLGDSGANALGAMLGAAAAAGLPRSARLAVLAGITGLTAASEVVSFTKVIAQTPALNWLDMLGRRPTAVPAAPSAAGPAGSAPPAAGPAAGGPASVTGDFPPDQSVTDDFPADESVTDDFPAGPPAASAPAGETVAPANAVP